MTSSTGQPHNQPAPAPGPAAQAEAGLAGYLQAMEDGGAPVLGYLVLYLVFDGQVTRDELNRWFGELGLDRAVVPPPIRAVDAFEKVTGPAGIRVTDPLNADSGQARRRRRQDAQGWVATLMIRHVRRDRDQIVRHLVREVRDEAATRLSYDTRLAECIFHRDSTPAAAHGAGALHLAPDHAAIHALAPGEQEQVRAMLADLKSACQRHRTYLGSDRLRGIVRTYIETLNAIRVRPTGGVYFVHHRHATTSPRCANWPAGSAPAATSPASPSPTTTKCGKW